MNFWHHQYFFSASCLGLKSSMNGFWCCMAHRNPPLTTARKVVNHQPKAPKVPCKLGVDLVPGEEKQQPPNLPDLSVPLTPENMSTSVDTHTHKPLPLHQLAASFCLLQTHSAAPPSLCGAERSSPTYTIFPAAPLASRDPHPRGSIADPVGRMLCTAAGYPGLSKPSREADNS